MNFFNLIKNIFFLLINKSVDLLIPMLLLPYLVTTIGEDNYGLYAFILSFFIIYLNLSNYSFALGSVRELAKVNSRNEIGYIFNKTFSSKVILVFFLLLFHIVLCVTIPSFKLNIYLQLGIIIMLIAEIFNFQWYFLGIQKMSFITLINFLTKMTFVSLVYLLIKDKEDYIFLTLIQSIGYVLAGIVSFLIVSSEKIKIRFLDFRTIFKYIKSEFNNFINLFIPSLFVNAVIFLSGFFVEDSELTIVVAVMSIIAVLTAFNTIIKNVTFPYLSNSPKESKKIRIFILISGGVLSLITFFFHDLIIDVWIGSSFTVDSLYKVKMFVLYLSPIPFFMSIVTAFGVNGLVINFQDKLFSKITVFSGFLLVICAFLLVPILGIEGSILAFFIGRVSYSLITFFFYFKLNHRNG